MYVNFVSIDSSHSCSIDLYISEPISIFHIYKQDLKIMFLNSFLNKMSQVVAYVSVTDSDSGPNGVTQCSVQQEEFTLEKLDSDTYKVGLVLSCHVYHVTIMRQC